MASAITAELLAVIVAVVDGQPCVLTLGDDVCLPAGPLMPDQHSLQSATRAWVEEQTGRHLGFLEQLYTFVNLDRRIDGDRQSLSVSYLGLTTPGQDTGIGRWRPWYSIFPWEDVRTGRDLLEKHIRPQILEWAAADPHFEEARTQRCAIAFGFNGHVWQPDWVLQRYELLYEVGLLPESRAMWRLPAEKIVPGTRMIGDQRRVLATGLARLRAKIQYRPVVFELMSPQFTLRQLQDCVEALAGTAVHTQNFRRLVANEDLVEETGEVAETGGRPARLFRFRREILLQRQVAGTKLPATRAR
ncbi:MAG: hypothetical protein LBU38_04480 [Propionibacteriaceae bacterium]|jgi:hypothetical protein|nr:hypothetical protein [Propionibacteriaceae bacterium]